MSTIEQHGLVGTTQQAIDTAQAVAKQREEAENKPLYTLCATDRLTHHKSETEFPALSDCLAIARTNWDKTYFDIAMPDGTWFNWQNQFDVYTEDVESECLYWYDGPMMSLVSSQSRRLYFFEMVIDEVQRPPEFPKGVGGYDRDQLYLIVGMSRKRYLNFRNNCLTHKEIIVHREHGYGAWTTTFRNNMFTPLYQGIPEDYIPSKGFRKRDI